MSNTRVPQLLSHSEEFQDVERSDTRLRIEVRDTGVRVAIAGLNRLIASFSSDADFLIITPYRNHQPHESFAGVQKTSDREFRELPKLFRKLVQTSKIGAYEFWIHGTEREFGRFIEVLSRAWFFVTFRDANVPRGDFLAAAQALGRRVAQPEFIVRLNGVCSLELISGRAKGIAANEIEGAAIKTLRSTGQYERWVVVADGEPIVYWPDYPAVIRPYPIAWYRPQTYVSVARSIGEMRYFAHLGMNHPGWHRQLV